MLPGVTGDPWGMLGLRPALDDQIVDELRID
jgi:hypothetical protein